MAPSGSAAVPRSFEVPIDRIGKLLRGAGCHWFCATYPQQEQAGSIAASRAVKRPDDMVVPVKELETHRRYQDSSRGRDNTGSGSASRRRYRAVAASRCGGGRLSRGIANHALAVTGDDRRIANENRVRISAIIRQGQLRSTEDRARELASHDLRFLASAQILDIHPARVTEAEAGNRWRLLREQ